VAGSVAFRYPAVVSVPSPFDSPLPAGRTFDVIGVGIAVLDHLFLLPRAPAPDTKVDALATTRQGGAWWRPRW
jgi:hypothetical protein